jgi:hypothetical protein
MKTAIYVCVIVNKNHDKNIYIFIAIFQISEKSKQHYLIVRKYNEIKL